MKVIDASVALKWVLPEWGRDTALGYRASHEKGADLLIVPPLFWYEVANGLRRRQGLDSAARASALEEIWAAGIEHRELDLLLLAEAVVTAVERGISVYDASYVVLARELKCQFVTADRRLWERMAEEKDVVLLEGAE